MTPIYLDYNATTPIDPQVAETMLPYLQEHFGNPSSSHVFGRQTRQAVDTARAQVATLIGARPENIVFTSGGTESNNWAIKGAALANRSRGNHIITSTVEHPAVTEPCRYLESIGFEVSYIPVDSDGMVDPADVAKAITNKTTLITIMHANNEVGTIEPIAEISKLAQQHGIVLHTDCAQSIGKVPVSIDALGVDLLSIAGHKLYAPKGIGALYIREGVTLTKLMHGADHERNLRAGTENVLEIVGLGKAAELCHGELTADPDHLRPLRDKLEKALLERFDFARINGHPEKRLPNTCSISFKNHKANEILGKLDGVAASAGAACHSDGVTVSQVLAAMQVPTEWAMGTLRLSVGRFTTESEINTAIDEISTAVG